LVALPNGAFLVTTRESVEPLCGYLGVATTVTYVGSSTTRYVVTDDTSLTRPPPGQAMHLEGTDLLRDTCGGGLYRLVEGRVQAETWSTSVFHLPLIRVPGALRGGMQQGMALPGNLAEALGSTKVPPAWSAEMQATGTYKFKDWRQDVMLWCMVTDAPGYAQAAAVVLRLSGLARELARSIPEDQITQGSHQDYGDGQGAIWRSPVEILLRGLGKRFAPLDYEQSLKYAVELMNFQRQPGESVDSVTARFDLVRYRAASDGFTMGTAGLAWTLLRALNIPPALWQQFLQPFNGNLPVNDTEMSRLIGNVRRQGHLYEQGGIAQLGHSSSRSSHGPGGQHFLTSSTPSPQGDLWAGWATASAPWQQFSEGQSSSSAGQGAYLGAASSDYRSEDPGALAGPASQCVQCGAFLSSEYEDDDASSSDTEADGSEHIKDLWVGYESYCETWEDPHTGAALRQEYLMAKRRWRQWSGRPFRRDRRNLRRKGGKKGKNRRSGYGKGHFWQEPASTLCPRCETYYKGRGCKGGYKGKRGNPMGKDGQPLRCSICDSEEHLWRSCPDEAGRQRMMAQKGGKGGQYNAVTAPPTDLTRDLQQALSGPSLAPLSGGASSGRWFVHGFAGEPAQEDHPATVEQQLSQEVDLAINHLNSWWNENAAEDRQPLALTTLPSTTQTYSLYHQPGEHSDDEESTPQQQQNVGGAIDPSRWFLYPAALRQVGAVIAWHSLTRLGENREGLLVDPGAFDNLMGSMFRDRLTRLAMNAGLGNLIREARLTQPIGVEGVGEGPQKAEVVAKLPIAVTTEGKTVLQEYEAPVVPNSDIPGLLGRRSLTEKRAILDMVTNKLHLCGPGPVRIVLPPNSASLDLQVSKSGHLMLPVTEYQRLSERGGRGKPVPQGVFPARDVAASGASGATSSWQ